MKRLPDLTHLLPADDLADIHPSRALKAGVYRIGPGRTRRLVPHRALRLTVMSGRLWLTTAGDDRDRFPGPGAELLLPAGTDITVEAHGPGSAMIAIEDVARPRFGRSAFKRALVPLERLRRWIRWRRDLRTLEGLAPERLADIGIDGTVAQAIWLRRHLLENRHRLDALRF